MWRLPGWSILSSPTPPLAVEIRTSWLQAGVLIALAVSVIVAALLSHLDVRVKTLLAIAALLLLLKAWRDECSQGLRALRIDDVAGGRRELTLRFANHRLLRAPAAGHAWLGTVAIFIYAERSGWRRFFGPQRFCITRDAVTADAFRRLRTRLMLG